MNAIKEPLRPGESRRGWWEIGQFDLPALPVLAARGSQDGPLVVVTGAVYGDESGGIYWIENTPTDVGRNGFVICSP